MGITMLVGMNNTRLKRKILIILDFRNDLFPTYLQLCNACSARFKAGLKDSSLVEIMNY